MIKEDKIKLKSVFIAAFISISIGVIFMWISTFTVHHTFSHYLWNAGYSFCIGMSLFSNSIVFNFVEKRYISWIEKPTRSILIAIAFHLLYSTFVIFFFNWLWFVLFSNHTCSSFIKEEWITVIGEYAILIVITAVLYANSFFKVWRYEAIQGEKLKQEAVSLQYQVLQNQVNPHFLFNSLNVLGNLIDIDNEKAKEYLIQLAAFYRNLLQLKDHEIISLEQEVNFVKSYVYLQKIRFGNSFNVYFRIDENVSGELIPLSLQMLIENAVKHNEISKEYPLTISISNDPHDFIFVENNINPKNETGNGHNIGLHNLKERYRYLTGKEVAVINANGFFKVALPLIKIEP
jgi:two-component system, LytTR family, sensor kinase